MFRASEGGPSERPWIFYVFPRSLLFIGSRDHRIIAIRGSCAISRSAANGKYRTEKKKGTENQTSVTPESRPFQGNSTRNFCWCTPVHVLNHTSEVNYHFRRQNHLVSWTCAAGLCLHGLTLFLRTEDVLASNKDHSVRRSKVLWMSRKSAFTSAFTHTHTHTLSHTHTLTKHTHTQRSFYRPFQGRQKSRWAGGEEGDSGHFFLLFFRLQNVFPRNFHNGEGYYRHGHDWPLSWQAKKKKKKKKKIIPLPTPPPPPPWRHAWAYLFLQNMYPSTYSLTAKKGYNHHNLHHISR